VKQVDFQSVSANKDEQTVFCQYFVLSKDTEKEKCAGHAQRLIDKQDVFQINASAPKEDIQQNGA
jgi:hypothetical protein